MLGWFIIAISIVLVQLACDCGNSISSWFKCSYDFNGKLDDDYDLVAA